MPITVYGNPFSPFVARVVLAATLKGLKFKVDMPADGMKCAAMLKINPFGKMPVMIDGAVKLFESSVIVEYLDAKSKAKPLVPKSAKAGAAVRLVAAVAGEYVQSAGLKLFHHWFSKSTDAAALDAVKAELDKGLDALEGLVPRGKFAAGSRVSMADVYAVPALFIAVQICALLELPQPLGGRKKLGAYWKSIHKDKVLRAMLDDMTANVQMVIAHRG